MIGSNGKSFGEGTSYQVFLSVHVSLEDTYRP